MPRKSETPAPEETHTPDAEAEPEQEHEQPAANPLEAIRRAQAKRTPPPGTQPAFGGNGNRGGNPKALRTYNRHK